MTSSQDQDTSPYSITEEILQRRLNKPIYGHLCRQIFAGLLVCLSSFSFGTILGWTNSVTSYFNVVDSDFTLDEICWLTCLPLFGFSLGVTSCTFLIGHMGPKKALRFIGPFYIINWFVTLLPKIKVQMAGRFFLGMLGLAYTSCGDTLFLHTVHIGIRKYISIIQDSTMTMGILMSRVVGTATSQFWLTIICAVIPSVHYVLIQIVPESPVHLFATSQPAAAKSLTWYRGEGNFYQDMAHIRRDWDSARLDSDTYRYMLFSRVVYRSLFVIIGVSTLQAISGYFIFMFFGPHILTGKVVLSAVYDSSIVAACFVFTRIFWQSLHTVYSSWKVRALLICSCFFTGLSLGCLAVYLVVDPLYDHPDDTFHCVPMVIIGCFLFFVDMGLNHYTKILLIEYMPVQMYKRATSIVTSLFWVLAAINVFAFARTFDEIPHYYVFGSFSIVMFLGSLFCYFFVVEPKGQSLVQIQLKFGGNPTGTRGSLWKQLKQTV